MTPKQPEFLTSRTSPTAAEMRIAPGWLFLSPAAHGGWATIRWNSQALGAGSPQDQFEIVSPLSFFLCRISTCRQPHLGEGRASMCLAGVGGQLASPLTCKESPSTLSAAPNFGSAHSGASVPQFDDSRSVAFAVFRSSRKTSLPPRRRRLR